MLAIIDPGYVRGEIRIPPSKSMMQRACAAALLHNGKTIINNPGISADDKAALNIIKDLGADVIIHEDYIEVNSTGLNPTTDTISCGESGLSTRLFIPIVALSTQQITVTGKGSLMNRPMTVIHEVLPQLDVHVEHTDGKLPFMIKGPLRAKHIEVDGSAGSQFLSGLLFAYAFAAKEDIVISVKNLKSKPYIDITLEVLKTFGREIQHENYERFIISPSLFVEKQEVVIDIEGDWSSAANWLVAGAINGSITLKGLNPNSKQADVAVLKVLELAGADIIVDGNNITSTNANRLSSFDFDATDCPDLFPILSVLAACAYRDSSITGVHRLMTKESNRIVSTGDMLHEFGIYFSVEDDTLVISARKKLEHATIDSYNDHRIVMAAAIGTLKAQNSVVITEAEAVNKSYPQFFEHLSALGANCILKEQ